MSRQFRFDELTRTYMVAEIGINHNGDVAIARELIDYARVFKWDCVKFQKRNPDICVPESQKGVMRDTPWGRMTYLEYRWKLEFNEEQYTELWRHSGTGVHATASVWDEDSVDFMLRYNVPFLKIPSAHLTNDDLIEYVCKRKVPILLSTGMSELAEVDHAVEVLQRHTDNFALLHCHSSYPAPEEELNLQVIRTLQQRYGCPIGYSGHEFGLTATVAAVALGARIIERHVTLRRTMWGSDQMASVEPQGMLKLAQQIRSVEGSLGDGKKRVYPSEMAARQRLRPTPAVVHA